MSLLSPLQETVVTAIGWSLIHSLWIGALVAFCAWIVVSLMRDATANSRYVVLLLALMSIPAGAITCTTLMRRDPVEPLASVDQPDDRDADVVSTEYVEDGSSPIVMISGNGDLQADTDQTTAARHTPTSQSATAAAGSTAMESVTLSQRVSNWIPWLVWAWLAGVGVLSVRLLLGCVSLRRLLSSGTPVSQDVADLAARISSRIHLDRTIRVVESTLAEVPTTIGFFWPVILLPFSSLGSLSAKELESILAHELAHIYRGDFLVNVFQTIVEVLLFYHPAVWWLSRRIRQEREHACDDMAICVTGSRLQYARALAAVAEQAMHSNRLAMTANGGQFSMRIQRILGGMDAPQSSPSAIFSAGVLAAVLIGVTLVLIRPAESTASNANADTQSDSTVANLLEPISGTILGPNGKPLPAVTVYLRRRPFRYHDGPIELAQVTTGSDGRFDFRDVTIPKITHPYQKSVFPVDVIAMKAGHSIRWRRLTNSQTDVSMQMRKESQFNGVLKDDNGKSVANATVRVRNLMSLNTITQIDVAGGHTASQNGDSFLDISESVACISATTDKDGRFVLRELPNRVGLILGTDDRRLVDTLLYAATTDKKLPDIPAGKLIFPPRPETVGQFLRRQVSAEMLPIHTSPAEIQMTRGVHVHFQVLDDATGQPVSGTTVTVSPGPPVVEQTGDDGACDFYRLEPGSESIVNVHPPATCTLLGCRIAGTLSSDLQVEREIRLKQGAIVAGRVIDADTKVGLPDAIVSFTPEAGIAAGPMMPVEVTSDAAGDFRLRLPAISGRVVVSRAPAGYLQPRTVAPQEQGQEDKASLVTASLEKPVEGFEIAIERRPAIPIEFVDAGGVPQAVSADVRVYSSSNSYFSSTEEVDASGKLDVSQLVKSPQPPTAIQILARSADNRLAGFFRSKEIADLQAGEAHPIVLRPTASVRGQIFNKETSTPIPGAGVSLSVSYTATGGQGVGSFTCDKNGGYEFDDLVPGMQYSLGVTADGYIRLNSIHTRFVADQGEMHTVDIGLLPDKPKQIIDLESVEAPAVDGLDPERAYDVLADEYTKAYAAYRDLLKKQSSGDIRDQIVSLCEPTPVYAAALMKLANDNRGTAVELKSLIWLCKAHRIAGTEQRYRNLRTEAAARLLKDYSDRQEIADVVSSIIYASSDSYAAAQQLMKSTHREVRGRACFSCASIVGERYLDPHRGGHDVLRQEAIALYQKVVDDYSEIIRWDGETIGEAAGNKLFELKELQIGATAPEIQGVDLDGKPMKLSDFRGRVVVVYYWKSGLAFFDRLKNISEEYKDKPLVIIGVNIDEDRDKAIAAAKQQELVIRSWHDPKHEIHARWSGSWPDTHVISHDGKILYRGQRRSYTPLEDVLDQAVLAAGQATQ